jgi:dihydroorotate dehydrogenase (fumarate)
VRCSLAATSGVETAADVARFLLAGADVVMTASALLRHGVEYAGELLAGLEEWMTQKGFGSVDDLRGLLAVPREGHETRFERAGYVAAMRNANTGSYE